jgi:hypothetical protein
MHSASSAPQDKDVIGFRHEPSVEDPGAGDFKPRGGQPRLLS